MGYYMKLQDFLAIENVIVGLKADTKAHALRQLADIAAAKTGVSAGAILENLMGRERLGSTGIGDGIAIPHARLEGLEDSICICAKLFRPVDFDALDEQRVTFIVLLLSPVDEGRDALNMLSCVARKFRNERVLPGIDHAEDAEQIYAVLTSPD